MTDPAASDLALGRDVGPLGQRIAGAPISWGVCEVPGWGHQLDADTVLTQMRELGLVATEFGPIGFLDEDPRTMGDQLAAHELRAVGGFLPVVMHDPDHDPLPEAERFVTGCLACGAGVVVLAAATGADGYDDRPDLDDIGWATLLANLDRITDHATDRGIVACLHPHVGTVVETAAETERILGESRVGLCVDTGHLAVAGADPIAMARAHADRVRHVHLKDVDARLTDAVSSGHVTFAAAVKAGVFRPLGQGDLDIATLVKDLEAAGYEGWYVLEQDVMLNGESQEHGPAHNVQSSLDFLRGLAP